MKEDQTKYYRVKPTLVLNQEGISDSEKKAVLDGASELIRLAEVEGIDLVDLGVWRNDGYKNEDGSLNPFQSVDWFIQKGKEQSRNTTQLNGGCVQDALGIQPWGKLANPRNTEYGHCHLLIVHSDMYCGDTNFMIGLAQKEVGAIISTHRFRELRDSSERYECIKTETMHELGHVFGLLPDNRTENVENSLGKHCTNRCIMRQGLSVPSDWINMTKDRLEYGALCELCHSDLKAYFRA